MKTFSTLLAVFCSLLLASCGGAGGVSNSIDVVMTDFQFQPTRFTVPAGGEIAFTGSNNGAVIHNFVIMKLGTDAGDFFDEEDVPNVYWEIELVPGASTSTTFTAPEEPGEYHVICRTEGHIVSGMRAELSVVPAEQ